jgi:hypothetical protein
MYTPAPLPHRFRTASAPLPHHFRTASAPLPHHVRTTSTPPPRRFRTVSGLLIILRKCCWAGNTQCFRIIGSATLLPHQFRTARPYRATLAHRIFCFPVLRRLSKLE